MQRQHPVIPGLKRLQLVIYKSFGVRPERARGCLESPARSATLSSPQRDSSNCGKWIDSVLHFSPVAGMLI